MKEYLLKLQWLYWRNQSSDQSSTPSQTPRASYIYSPLDRTKREIRICDLVSSSNLSAPLQCSLRTAPMDQAGNFVAMSYVWGENSSTECISIDGTNHPIRPNLAAGLRRFRARFSEQRQVLSIWADAICINQNSVDERNHQVPLMRSIFSQCESAFAWLGESDESSNLAMDTIVKMDGFLQQGMIGDASFLWMLVQDKFFWKAEPWIALSKLLQRELWYRVWIYQEIILPMNLMIACGSRVLPWKNFRALNGMRIFRNNMENSSSLLRRHFAHLDLETRNDIKVFCNTLHPVFQHKVNFDSGRRLTIFELLAETIHLRSTDPRDKIYGLLALDQNSAVLPDYFRTVQQVYTDFAKTMILDDLAYLRFSGLFTRGSDTTLADLPSWVPHWDSMSKTMTTSVVGKGKSFLHPRTNLSQLEFHGIPDATALHICGEVSSIVAWAKDYQHLLDAENFRSMIAQVNGKEYTVPIPYPRTPKQRVIALFCTLLRVLLRRNSIEDMELAAGFCSATYRRLNASRGWRLSLTLADLLEPFGEYFEYFGWTETCHHAERFQNDYLMRERESLQGRLFFETLNGYFGLGPLGTQPGDFLCQIYGYYDPVVLRKVDSHYVLIGSCWALDYTDHYGDDRPRSEMLEIW
ncbi:hypothetical protein EG329_011083 [Mollisiaceae sp. DMI_Dod_QoI]|nr:hypothetical protein EG329_011083 [Helotiales sp. DMI_Dod_QoI]